MEEEASKKLAETPPIEVTSPTEVKTPRVKTTTQDSNRGAEERNKIIINIIVIAYK